MQRKVSILVGVVVFVGGVICGGVTHGRITSWIAKRVKSVDDPAITNINQQLAVINQQLNVSYAAYSELAKTAQATDVAQATELTILGRVMSDYFGKAKWERMVSKSKEGLIAELKQAQEAQQRAAQNPK